MKTAMTMGCVLLACAHAVSLARADRLLLKNGSQLQGQVIRQPNDDSDTYVVQLDGGTRVRIDAKQVGRVDELTPAEKRYAALLPDMPDSAHGHFTMATWCHKHGLRDLKQLHLEYVLQHDPDHAEARKQLGYSLLRGKWMRSDDYMRSQGYERYRGSWRLPEQIELDKQSREREVAEKRWQGQIRRWRGWLKGRQRDQGLENLRAIDDPLAAPALAELLPKESDEDVRMLYVDALGRLPSVRATAGLIEAALQDEGLEVRLRAIEHLRARGAHQSVGPLIRALRSPDNVTVRRAGVALGRLGDASAVRPLIDALVTSHTFVVQPRDNIQTSFGGTPDGSQGLNGLRVGGGPKKVTRQLQNKSVLEALVSLTGQNYRYAKSEWKQWYIRQRSLPDSVNLRRDA